jgi:hypothetical protein
MKPVSQQKPEWESLFDLEKEIYVDKLTLQYDGFFEMNELMNVINKWADDNQYFFLIANHTEAVGKHGKNVGLSIQVHKPFSGIYISLVNISMTIKGLTEVPKTIDGLKRTLNKASVKLVFHGFLGMNIKHRWETKPGYFTFRKIIDKFVYKLDRAKYPGKVVDDTTDLATKIRAFFDLYAHKLHTEETEVSSGKAELGHRVG